MKKLMSISILIMLTMGIFCISSNALAISAPVVKINDDLLKSDVRPKIINQQIFIPLRAVCENLAANVFWDNEKKCVTIETVNSQIKLVLGDNTAEIIKNQQVTTYNLDLAATIVDDRILVPLRFVAETLGCKVDWEETKKIAFIDTLDFDIFTKNNQTFILKLDEQRLYLKNDNNFILVADNLGLYQSIENDSQKDKFNCVIDYVIFPTETSYIIGLRLYPKDFSSYASLLHSPVYIDSYYIHGDTVLKNKTTVSGVDVIHTVEYSIYQSKFFDGKNIYLPGDDNVMKIDKDSDQILTIYDLPEMVGIDKKCWYGYIDGDYMLVRCLAQLEDKTCNTGYPVLINLQTNEVIWLHEYLISSEFMFSYNKKYLGINSGSTLKFVGVMDGVWSFEFTEPNYEDKYIVTYDVNCGMAL